jgi:hypothetical protein
VPPWLRIMTISVHGGAKSPLFVKSVSPLFRPLLCLVAITSSASGALAQGVNFAAEILPIFQKSCFDCHQEPKEINGKLQKPKGGLRMDSARGIVMGGTEGEIIVPGKPGESTLWTVINLPSGDSEAMPPKNKGQPLSATELASIHKWITQGAKFGPWRGNEKGLPPGPAMPANLDPWEVAKGGATQQSLEQLGVVIVPIDPAKGTVRVEFMTEPVKIKDDHLKGLAEMAPKIIELDLSRTSITDAGLEHLKKCAALKRLNLRNTQIGDAGLAHLSGLVSLEYLNVVNTKITDKGIPSLKGLKNLKRGYFYGTEVSDYPLVQLAKGAAKDAKMLKGGWEDFMMENPDLQKK